MQKVLFPCLCGGLQCILGIMLDTGEVPEWTIGAVSKTVVALAGYRGFESHPLRWRMLGEKPGILLYCGYLKLRHLQPTVGHHDMNRTW